MLEVRLEPRSVLMELAPLSGFHGSWRPSTSSFNITNEKSESQLVAEPGKNIDPLFDGQHVSS